MQILFEKITKIIRGPSSQLDPYASPNDDQIFNASHKSSQQTLP